MKKWPDEITNDWDPERAKEDSKQHWYITNTYLNTRLGLDSANQEEAKIDAAAFKDKIQDNMPKNNRNVNMKSSTFNNTNKAEPEEQKRGIKWVDHVNEKRKLFEVIVDKPRSKLKESVVSHRRELTIKPVIKKDLLRTEPKVEFSKSTTNAKQTQNGPLMFNMQMQKHLDDSFEQAKQLKKQVQRDDSKGMTYIPYNSIDMETGKK